MFFFYQNTILFDKIDCVYSSQTQRRFEAECGTFSDITVFISYRDTIDAVKQSAALCLLRLLRSSHDIINMSEWASRIIHLLNDQHMVTRYTLILDIC